MTDKIRIGFAPLANFSTAPWADLIIVDGKVTVNVEKTFNWARMMLNNGANIIRLLRRGIWETVVGFDFESPDYFSVLKDHAAIVHQPAQGEVKGEGATVWIEVFDGCSEEWMYDPAQWERARNLLRGLLSTFKDVPYVVFGMGNEMNRPEVVPLVQQVIVPEFQAAGMKPFSFGAIYSTTDDWLEKQKQFVGLAWGDDQENRTYRPVHSVLDKDSVCLTDTVGFWMPANNPISIFWSPDGIWGGDNICDRALQPNGTYHARPSTEQIRSSMRYWMANAKSFALPDGQPKFGFEYIPKSPDRDCTSLGVKAISEVYFEKFGEWPANYGKYPNDWVAPIPPECQIGEVKKETCWDGSDRITHTCENGKWTPTGNVCPPPPQPVNLSCMDKYISHRPVVKMQIWKFIKCILGVGK